MVLIGLLLIALVCLALGLVLASAGWLVGSLAASAVAAWVLWRARDGVGAAGGPEHEAREQLAASATAGSEPAEVLDDAMIAPDYARRRADALSGGGATPIAATGSEAAVGTTLATRTAPEEPAVAYSFARNVAPTEVWVVDGRPNYHSAHCGVLLGADAESIPYTQAVDDGFTPCTLCDPDSYPSAPQVTGDAGATGAGSGTVPMVWVSDGWPHYHDPNCPTLAAAGESEPVPFAQAVDDGFTPCPTCRSTVTGEVPPAEAEATVEPEVTAEPEAVVEPEAAVEPEPEATVDPEPEATVEPEPEAVVEREPEPEVWVVAGRPRYHLRDCIIIVEQGATPLALTQATDDGFKPCSLCEPPS